MLLSSIFLFKDLSESHLKKISNTVKETCAEKGRWLFHEGSSADRIYALRSGAVELLTRINDDIELPVKIIRNEGGCFGISALIRPYQYSLSSRCAEDTVLLEIKRKDIEKLTQEAKTSKEKAPKAVTKSQTVTGNNEKLLKQILERIEKLEKDFKQFKVKGKGKPKPKKPEGEAKVLICWECNEEGHYRNECPNKNKPSLNK